MAFVTGTATDHQDLYNQLIGFLTTNGDLVSSSEQWSVAWQNGNDLVMEGPGLTGADEILVAMRLNEDVPLDRFSIVIKGATGVLPSALQYDEHVNMTPDGCQVFLDNEPMQYWFIANGRRFMAVVKVNTVYQSMYGGLILPYSPPTIFDYPLFVGGCAGESGSGQALDWRSTANSHADFVHASRDPDGGSFTHESSAKFLDPAGQWLTCSGANVNDSDRGQCGIAPLEFFDGFSINQDTSSPYYGYRDLQFRMKECFGGEYALTPVTLMQQTPSDQTFGVLQGVYVVPGRGNSAENIITINGVDHLVVQNTFRSNFNDYIAIALD